VRHVGEIWLIVGIGALLFRTVQLFFLKDVQTGLVWATKILTDPFNDVKIYYKAPLLLDARRAHRSDGRSRSRSPPGLKHFLEHAAPDRPVREFGVVPPPAVALHFPGRRQNPVGDFGEVRVGVIQAEDEAPRAHPAQGQPRRRADNIETSSCSSRRLRVIEGPDRGQVRDPHGQCSAARRWFSARAREFQVSSRSRYRARTGSVSSFSRNSYIAPMT
jgi:hypothetical protein